jgi:hypothetical protein
MEMWQESQDVSDDYRRNSVGPSEEGSRKERMHQKELSGMRGCIRRNDTVRHNDDVS